MYWVCEYCGTEVEYSKRHKVSVCPTCGMEASAELLRDAEVNAGRKARSSAVRRGKNTFLQVWLSIKARNNAVFPWFEKLLSKSRLIGLLVIILALASFLLPPLLSGADYNELASNVSHNLTSFSPQSYVSGFGQNLMSFYSQRKAVDGLNVSRNLTRLLTGHQAAIAGNTPENLGLVLSSRRFGAVHSNLRRFASSFKPAASSYADNVLPYSENISAGAERFVENISVGWGNLVHNCSDLISRVLKG